MDCVRDKRLKPNALNYILTRNIRELNLIRAEAPDNAFNQNEEMTFQSKLIYLNCLSYHIVIF